MSYDRFIASHHELLSNYWKQISSEIAAWRNSYEWPKGTYLNEAIKLRNELEELINNDLNEYGYLTKEVFDRIMIWGFGSPSDNNKNEIRDTTQKAFNHLLQGKLADAASTLIELHGIGISRASKVLALSNQTKFGIYDSRAAHGLSDLKENDRNLIPIPPGRTIAGDRSSSFCKDFENYIYVITFFHNCASNDERLRITFERVSDIEIAFFARSRNNLKQPSEYQAPNYMYKIIESNIAAIDEGELFWTLGRGNKAKPFWARINEKGIRIFTGENGNSTEYLDQNEMQKCIMNFNDKEWFPLGNNITKIESGGLGEYFKNSLHKSPKYASHYAAIWVSQHLLAYRCASKSKIELKTISHRF